jgi:hypothetical protein
MFSGIKQLIMKITKIEREIDKSTFIYNVTFEPNWFERLFSKQTEERRYQDTGKHYKYGGGTVYIKQNGEYLDNGDNIGEAIDNFRRSF